MTILNMMLCRTSLLLITVILAAIIARYYVPVRLPGPMVHPLKYRIISGSFGLILEFVSYTKLQIILQNY